MRRSLLSLVGVLIASTIAAAQCRTLQQAGIPSAGYQYTRDYISVQGTPVPLPVQTVPSCTPCTTGMVGAAYTLPTSPAVYTVPQQQPIYAAAPQPAADTTALLNAIAQYLAQSQTQTTVAYTVPQPTALPVTYAAPPVYMQPLLLPTRGYYTSGRSFAFNSFPSYGYGYSHGVGRSFVPTVTTGGFGAFGTGIGTGAGPGSLIGQFRQGVSTGGLAGGLERFTGLGNGSGQFVGGALTGILATRANLFGLGKGIR